MKWRTSKQLPPHMLISGNTLATFDAITAYYWIPLKEFKEELEEGK